MRPKVDVVRCLSVLIAVLAFIVLVLLMMEHPMLIVGWFVICATVVCVIAEDPGRDFRRARLGSRLVDGCCPSCGYGPLHYSGGSCPECGS